MAAVTSFRDWLVGQSGVTIITDNAPNMVHFMVNHQTGVSHKALIDEAIKTDMWILSKGLNTATNKEYKVQDQSQGEPTW